VKWPVRALLGALALALVVAAGGLALAHREIRARDPELPSDAEVLALAGTPGGPAAVAWHETSHQAMPRARVLDPSQDPDPGAPYVMGHPSFALAWPDGRLLLVDLGMEREAALAFGRPLEWAGAEPAVFESGAAGALGPAAERVAGAVFTHLHSDHVEGVIALCLARGGAALPVFQTAAQASLSNYTTRPGRQLLEQARCPSPQRLPEGRLAPVAGFPGVGVVDAAGHTPGSQVVLAVLSGGAAPRRLAFTGDVANHVEGIRRNVRKPFLYSLLVVPEAPGRLDRVRRWLRHLESDLGFELVVAHDRAQLAALALPPFSELLRPDSR
jgi:glyoxylase-like metal-dependent hydrolase (beta-lactamase superfamily II)